MSIDNIILLIEHLEKTTEDHKSLCAALYQACGAYHMPERVLDALSAAANAEEFSHLIDDILPCYPELEKE